MQHRFDKLFTDENPVRHLLMKSATGFIARKGDSFTRAYVSHLSHRIPLLYAVVLFDNWMLADRFYGSAPNLLTVWFPFLSSVILMVRASYWLPSAVAARSIATLERDLRSLAVVGPIVAFGCTAWALALYPYGDRSQQALVHYIVAITCFASILGLGQSPMTALRLAIVSLVPASTWFLLHHHPNAPVVCAVQLIVGMLLLLITYGYHRDFVALENARQIVALRERDANELADSMRTHAMHDPLTGATNRRAILGQLQELLQDESQPSPWLALVDLDGFKSVNDTFGHAAGDAVLKSVCKQIEGVTDLIAFGRLGGDEFAILLPGSLRPAEAKARLDDLIWRISQPIEFEGHNLAVTASIGLRLTQRRSVSECLERADSALYKAKRVPGRVLEFSAHDEQVLRERQSITRRFAAANLEDQISVVYQPIIDFDTRKVEAFEAFVRWSPDGVNWLQPNHFIGLAESTGRMKELTDLVLKRALLECPLGDGVQLCINLSAHDLMDDDVARRLSAIVADGRAQASDVTVEITEEALTADGRRVATNLAALRKSGFRITLDDFGTGQSSLSRVHQLPLDRIKIDRCFAEDLDTDPARQAIASTILALARQLGLGCTIEGIENERQAACARRLGVRSMQGFFFGRPLTMAETVDLLGVA